VKPSTSSPDPATWFLATGTLSVVGFADPLIEAVGYDARSTYAEAYWLGVLGPSALLALRRLNTGLDDNPDGFRVPVADLARELGLGHGPGRNTPVIRTLSRLITFGLADIRDDDLAVRRFVPPLCRRHLARLPAHLRQRHQSEVLTEPRVASLSAASLTA
jgi:hypothetical protein